MQRVALIVVTGLLSACAAKPADPGGCTTPLTAQCIDDRVWICQPDGDLKLTKICAAGCTDGECDPVPPPVDTPDVVEATDTGR